MTRRVKTIELLTFGGAVVRCIRIDDHESAIREATAEAERQRDELSEAIRQTLNENGHLADGDVCTLKRLKDALRKVGAGDTTYYDD